MRRKRKILKQNGKFNGMIKVGINRYVVLGDRYISQKFNREKNNKKEK